MGSHDGRGSPDFAIAGGRPRYKGNSESKYSVGDLVYLLETESKRGPYKIALVTAAGKYTLCEKDGVTAVNNSQEVDEGSLETALTPLD
ncbi:hypothetical protein SUNI508_07827 [Seiridium unicorne]|uniref:Uncharacterized protein n=1 Tax=Seiridium unicorne TaxID=138068 RepID=A0ABR2UV76_9PEZI